MGGYLFNRGHDILMSQAERASIATPRSISPFNPFDDNATRFLRHGASGNTEGYSSTYLAYGIR